jgi:hypothetical protein
MRTQRKSHEDERSRSDGHPRPAGTDTVHHDRDAVIADSRVVDRLPDHQMERMSISLQASAGNSGVAALLTGQRDASGPAASGPDAAERHITQLTARVNAAPSFIARTVAVLSRGDRVTLTGERRGGWHQVVTPDGSTGWIHESAWTSSRPRRSSAPGTAGGAEPPDEIEIGGRG